MTLTMVVATHNNGKLVEIRRILDVGLADDASRVELISAGSLDLPDPVETGVSFEQNALIKARDVAQRTGLPAVADDSGLILDFLGGAPGILSARWSGVHGDDAANNELLLAQIRDIPDAGRRARFRCAAAMVVPAEWSRTTETALAGSLAGPEGNATESADKPLESVEFGEMTGWIDRAPRGDHGFGYDPLFVPDDQPGRARGLGHPLTSAEMTAEEKNAISHRSKAFSALVPAIARLLA